MTRVLGSLQRGQRMGLLSRANYTMGGTDVNDTTRCAVLRPVVAGRLTAPSTAIRA
jgi:hypothetical protein